MGQLLTQFPPGWPAAKAMETLFVSACKGPAKFLLVETSSIVLGDQERARSADIWNLTSVVLRQDNIASVLGVGFGDCLEANLRPKLQLSYTKPFIFILQVSNMEIVLTMLTVMCGSFGVAMG